MDKIWSQAITNRLLKTHEDERREMARRYNLDENIPLDRDTLVLINNQTKEMWEDAK